MSVVLHRWGNSVGLRVPKPMLTRLGLEAGSRVELEVDGDRLVVVPVKKPRMSMAELLEGFTPGEGPGEMDWGQPAGREVW